MNNNDVKKQIMVFSAVDKYLEENLIEPTEKDIHGFEFIEWGDRNFYPSFIYDVYSSSATLKTIIQSIVDYTIGSGVESNEFILNDEKLEDIVSSIAFSYSIYGGFALNILRNKFGAIADIIPMDMRNIRSNKDNTLFYYSEYFGKRSYGRCKYVTYEKFDVNNKQQFSSIYYYKNIKFQTYPSPVWSAATNAAIIENRIGEYHMNNLANGFSSNIMVCLNNGTPTDEVQEQIEEDFNEKFCGSENSGRVMIAFSPDKEHAPNVEVIETKDYADKYSTLYDYSRQQLFTSFRMNPNLCGIATKSNGFNSEEYDSSFKLFNKTTIQPIQKIICNTFDRVFGYQDVITIEPFDLEDKQDIK